MTSRSIQNGRRERPWRGWRLPADWRDTLWLCCRGLRCSSTFQRCFLCRSVCRCYRVKCMSLRRRYQWCWRPFSGRPHIRTGCWLGCLIQGSRRSMRKYLMVQLLFRGYRYRNLLSYSRRSVCLSAHWPRSLLHRTAHRTGQTGWADRLLHK